MTIRAATTEDCRAIAELTLLVGAGIPQYIWGQSLRTGGDVLEEGVIRASSETKNFSYRNARVVVEGDDVAGMVLSYRLPEVTSAPDFSELPAFLRPMIELEQCAPGSYYVNMLGVYPQWQGRGFGKQLMAEVERLAAEAGCAVTSVQAFEQNEGALRFYQRLGYREADRRQIVPYPGQQYEGDVLLLVKESSASS